MNRPDVQTTWLARSDAILRQGLFVPSSSTPVTTFKVGLAIAALGLGTLLSVVRTTGPGALDTTMMEDASVFLSDALHKGLIEAVTTSYAGFFHLVPRLLGQVAALFPADWAAAVLAAEASLVTSLLSLMVYVASGGILQNRLQRLLVSAPMVVLPLAQSEMLNSIAMLRWYFIYATFWAMLWVPQTRWGRIIGPAVVILAALSDAVVWIFLPLVVLRWWLRRDRSAVVMGAALLFGTLMVATVVVTGTTTRGVQPRLDPVWALASYVLRPVPQVLVGSRWVTEGPGDSLSGLLPVAVGWLIVAAVGTLAFRQVTRPQWLLAGVAVFFSVAIYVFCVMTVGFAGPRYGAPTAMLVMTAMVALLTPRGEQFPGGRQWLANSRPLLPITGLAVLVALVCVVNLRVAGDRTGGPRWSDGLRAARTACDHGGQPVSPPTVAPHQPHPSIPPTGAITANIPVSPTRLAWAAHLPCDYLNR